MKHIKLYEQFDTNDGIVLVKCNWCDWIGEENELTKDENHYQYCQNCGDDNYLMDINTDDPLYSVYLSKKKYNL